MVLYNEEKAFTHFNSIKVRLEHKKTLMGVVYKEISIP